MKTLDTWEGTIDIPDIICNLDVVSNSNHLNVWKSILFADFMHKY